MYENDFRVRLSWGEPDTHLGLFMHSQHFRVKEYHAVSIFVDL